MIPSFLGLRPHALHPGAIQGKEGIKFCHLATLNAGFGPFRVSGGGNSDGSGSAGARGSAGFGPFSVSGRGSSGSPGSGRAGGSARFGPLSASARGRGSAGAAGGGLGFNFGKREAE